MNLTHIHRKICLPDSVWQYELDSYMISSLRVFSRVLYNVIALIHLTVYPNT